MCEVRSVDVVIHLDHWPCSGATELYVTLAETGSAPLDWCARAVPQLGLAEVVIYELGWLLRHLERTGLDITPF